VKTAQGKPSFSRRFSTVRNTDKIYVIDRGKIVEQGSHDLLIKRGGKPISGISFVLVSIPLPGNSDIAILEW